MIPEIGTWVKCKHKRLNYWITHFFSGHGSFKTFTKKIGKSNSDLCYYCNITDDPEHTIMLCPRWELIRRPCKEEYRLVDCKQMVALMLENKTAREKCETVIMNIGTDRGGE